VPCYPRVKAQFYILETYPYLSTKLAHILYMIFYLPYGTEILIKGILKLKATQFNLYRIYYVLLIKANVKVKHSHYRPMGPRGLWEVKTFRFRDIGN
jgi:hypothetical protein